MKIAKKIGGGKRKGTVFKSRRPTGEVLRPNAPGRDPIVTRILWLKGAERSTRNAYGRYIYIHGTPEEWRIGQKASYGCIRMKSKDVVKLYNKAKVGTEVEVTRSKMPREARKMAIARGSLKASSRMASKWRWNPFAARSAANDRKSKDEKGQYLLGR